MQYVIFILNYLQKAFQAFPFYMCFPCLWHPGDFFLRKMTVLKSRELLFGLMFLVFMTFLCYVFLKWDIGINYQIASSITTLHKNQDGLFTTCERICSIKNDTRCEINPIVKGYVKIRSPILGSITA